MTTWEMRKVSRNTSGSVTSGFLVSFTSGHLTWGGQGFSKKARNMSISSDGPDHDPVLHVDLAGSDGKYTTSEIDLAEHIANIDGEMVVLPL